MIESMPYNCEICPFSSACALGDKECNFQNKNIKNLNV